MKLAHLLSIVGPLAAGATPITEFDCSYLNGYLYQRVPFG